MCVESCVLPSAGPLQSTRTPCVAVEASLSADADADAIEQEIRAQLKKMNQQTGARVVVLFTSPQLTDLVFQVNMSDTAFGRQQKPCTLVQLNCQSLQKP